MASAPLLGAAATLAAAEEAKPAVPQRKIKLGLVGCGGRGSWIGKLFQEHGGYELHAVADYFPHVADRCGDASGRGQGAAFLRPFRLQEGDRKRRGGRGPDRAAVLPARAFQRRRRGRACTSTWPSPWPSTCPAACASRRRANRRRKSNKVFLVDYQIPTDPMNIEVAEADAGRQGWANSPGCSPPATAGGRNDPPKTANIESRLQGLVWDNDIALGGGMNVSFDIHAIDAGLWVPRPTSRRGHGQSRASPGRIRTATATTLARSCSSMPTA